MFGIDVARPFASRIRLLEKGRSNDVPVRRRGGVKGPRSSELPCEAGRGTKASPPTQGTSSPLFNITPPKMSGYDGTF
jgi:hypothetical protein